MEALQAKAEEAVLVERVDVHGKAPCTGYTSKGTFLKCRAPDSYRTPAGTVCRSQDDTHTSIQAGRTCLTDTTRPVAFQEEEVSKGRVELPASLDARLQTLMTPQMARAEGGV